jgi:hypothetical protein
MVRRAGRQEGLEARGKVRLTGSRQRALIAFLDQVLAPSGSGAKFSEATLKDKKKHYEI